MIRLFVTALAAAALAACATPNGPIDPRAASASDAAIEAFKPRPDGRTTAIDYSVVDDFLDAAVVNLGASTRKLAPAPRNPTETRIRIGHQSKLRLEGNKIAFSQFDRTSDVAVQEYADSLIAIGNQIDITKLPKNAQLAYWFNLHNMVVIATIAERYPVREPREMFFGPERVPFHDAKLIELRGVKLSLKDIRQNIVYRYWDDPRVMYGFFHGDLASPSIRDDAWDPRWLNRDLGRNAKEFINSLRGVDKLGRDTLLVSSLYEEARGTLFKNWPNDFRDHLLDYSNAEVTELIEKRRKIEYSPYEDRVADLAGGQPYTRLSPGQNLGVDPRLENLPVSVLSMITDVQRKFESPEFRATRRARVTIIDSNQQDEDSGEVE